MTTKSTSDSVLFMSTGMFEHLSDTEAYVFSHIAFFASQIKYKRKFKATTRAICNRVGYSPNTVREALRSLVQKRFLIKEEQDLSTRKDDYIAFTPYEDIAHHLKIGEHKYAQKFSTAYSKMIIAVGRSEKITEDREISFFKVHIGKLQPGSLKANQSKHVHKLLILHGYLFNQAIWNLNSNRKYLARSVSFLSKSLGWSMNTVRRLINTLHDKGIIVFQYDAKALVFSVVKPMVQLTGLSKLNSRLMPISNAAAKGDKAINTLTQSPISKKQSFTPDTPQAASAYLRNYQTQQQ